MYVPFGWPKKLLIGHSDDKALLKCIVCNRYRMLFAILTETTISIWHCKPCVEIICYQRSVASISSNGTNCTAEWRQDSSMLAVATSNHSLLIYQLEQDVKNQKGLNLYDYVNTKTIQGDSNDSVPALRLTLKHAVAYNSPIVSISCVHDNLLISMLDGNLELLSWADTDKNRKCIPLHDVPFFVDLYQNTGSKMKGKGLFVSQLKYSPYMDGFAIVLSNGRAALMIMASTDDQRNPINVQDWDARCVWASGLNNAVCTTVNNKYRLLAFGTSLGKCDVYGWDDVTGALQLSHEIALSKVNYPGMYNKTGAVSVMQWSPDGCALALSWSRGGFSLWTVYGACLMCTLGDEHILSMDGTRKQQAIFTSICWGAEGYQLWAVWRNVKISQLPEDGNGQAIYKISEEPIEGDLSTSTDAETNNDDGRQQLIQLNFLKSALTMNPCANNHLHVFLQGEDRLLVSYGDQLTTKRQAGMTNEDFDKNIDIDRIVGNKQWTVIQMPIAYLSGNWPIRYTSIDRTGQLIVIAGNFGLAHYSNITQKWKLFGNIMQEKDMVVTGGLTWWRNFVIVACYDLLDNQDEIRIYPRTTNLDNVFASTYKINSQILLVNVYSNIVIVFDASCTISMFVIGINENVQHDNAVMFPLKVLSAAQFVPYPSLVVSVTMSSLHMESGSRKNMDSNRQQETEVIIINVAGRLLLLQRNLDAEGDMDSDLSLYDIPTHKKSPANLMFTSPVVLASSVENIWTTEQKNRERIHLSDALWLNCGSAGLRVWLPLFPHPTHNTRKHTHRDFQTLQSRRITLNLEPDTFYPLTVLFQNAIVLGFKSETTLFRSIGDASEDSLYNFPYSTIERTSQIYLHQILRQLLRRNLGYHALQLALSCRSLPYFPHVLELMLHKVVEEEATASAPIPDPLLPTVVKFLGEFPEYLQTIVHCARKTEIALWQYLFNSVGVPRELFQECLDAGELETATSYLIILQNLEKLSVARQDATRLLDAALQAKKWDLASDITRFLKAIGVGDGSTSPRHPTLLNTNIYPAVAPNAINMADVDLTKINPPSARKTSARDIPLGRQYSMLSGIPDKMPYRQTAYTKDDSSKHPQIKASLSMPTPSLNTSDSTDKTDSEKRPVVSECAEHYFIDVILTRQAKKLLADMDLKSLFTFGAHLGFQLVPWLRKEKSRVAKVTDAVDTLKKIHANFEWPYPIAKASTGSLYKGVHPQSAPSLPTLEQQLASTKIRNSTSEDNSFVMVPQNMLLDAQRHFQQAESPLHSTQENNVTMLSTHDRGSSWTLNAFSEASEVSEMSALVEDVYVDQITDDVLELAMHNRPPRAEMQLTYILELMLQSDCLEIAMIVALIMANSSSIHKVVHSARNIDEHIIPLETLQRTRDCLIQIEKWAATDCTGYLAVLRKVSSHIQELYSIVTAREVSHAEEQAMLAMNPTSEKLIHARTLSSDSSEKEMTKHKLNLSFPGKAQPAMLDTEEEQVIHRLPRSRHNSVPTPEPNSMITSHTVKSAGDQDSVPTKRVPSQTETLESDANPVKNDNASGGESCESSEEEDQDEEGGCIIS